MKLSHVDLETQFTENKINVLVVEDPPMFRRLCLDMYDAVTFGTGNFVLSDGENILNMSKCGIMLADLTNFDFSGKKLLNRLYVELGCMVDEKYSEDMSACVRTLLTFMDKINTDSSVPIDYSEDILPVDLFKALGVKIKYDTEEYSERLCDYLRASMSLLKIKFICFVNLKSYLTEYELTEIYKLLSYNGIFCLLLENAPRNKLENEYRVIIDSDICEIVD